MTNAALAVGACRISRGGIMTVRRKWRRATSPLSWSIAIRRLFLLFLPVSVVVWIGYLAALAVAAAFRDLSKPFIRFWHAPPETLRSCSYRYEPDYRETKQPRSLSLVDREAA